MLVFAMSFAKDDCLDIVEFIDRSQLNAVKEFVQEELEMLDSGDTTIEKMGGSDRVNIGNIRSDFVKEFFCLSEGDRRDSFATLTEFEDVVVVLYKAIIGGSSDLFEGLEISNAIVETVSN